MNGENRFEQIAGMAILLLLVIGCVVVLRPFGFLGIFLAATLLASIYEILRDLARFEPPLCLRDSSRTRAFKVLGFKFCISSDVC
jgi:hypothetical protein